MKEETQQVINRLLESQYATNYSFVSEDDATDIVDASGNYPRGFIFKGTGQIVIDRPDGTTVTIPDGFLKEGQIYMLSFRKLKTATADTITDFMAIFRDYHTG